MTVLGCPSAAGRGGHSSNPDVRLLSVSTRPLPISSFKFSSTPSPSPSPFFTIVPLPLLINMRPTTLQATRAIFRRFASTSSSTPQSLAQNPQVKNAVEGATKAYEQAMSGAKRVAGPLGERAGSMLGGTWTKSASYCIYLANLGPITQATAIPSFTTSKSSPLSVDKFTSLRSLPHLPTSPHGLPHMPRSGRGQPALLGTGRSLRMESGQKSGFT